MSKPPKDSDRRPISDSSRNQLSYSPPTTRGIAIEASSIFPPADTVDRCSFCASQDLCARSVNPNGTRTNPCPYT